MTAPLGSLIDHGVDILSTTLDKTTNRILAFLGDVKAQFGDSDRAKWVQHEGFASRPPKAVAGKIACQATIVRRSDGDLVIGSTDSRTIGMYANLGDGESCVYAGGADGTGQARLLCKADGSVNMYTRAGNASGGAGMVCQLDAANNAARMLNGLGFGIIAGTDDVTITSAAASITLKADGSASIVSTKGLQIDGTSVMLGSSPTLTAATNAVMINPASLVQFLGELVTAIATITAVTPGATAMAPIAPALLLLSPGTPGTGIGAQKVLAE